MVTLNDYLEMTDKAEIDFALCYSRKANEPIDLIEIGEISEYSFGLVKDMQYQLDKGLSLFDAVKFFGEMGKDKLGIKDIFILNSSYRYLIAEISRVNKIESELLSGLVKPDEIEAGIEELNSLGIYLQLRQIALTFHTTIEQAKAMPYNDCFLELVTQKKLKDFESSLIAIRSRKQ